MMISVEEIEKIKREYNEFRKTPRYEERKNQLAFSDFARDVIIKLLQKESITNENLTALIQIFGNGSTSDNVKKYVTIQVALTRLHIFPRSEEKLDIK